ncbi:MAG: hypothetical protein MJE77_09665 [Proteobacteria bacterium]|nr:hypothetical protein [Pseudomonadota bacterium]
MHSKKMSSTGKRLFTIVAGMGLLVGACAQPFEAGEESAIDDAIASTKQGVTMDEDGVPLNESTSTKAVTEPESASLLATGRAASAAVTERGQPDIIIDNHHHEIGAEISFTGNWPKASAATEHFGNEGRFAEAGGEVDTYRFTPNFAGPGDYRVMVWNNCHSPRDTNVPHTIVYDGGTTTIEVDQDCNTGSHGEWLELGTFPFAAGDSGYLEISDAGLTAGSYIGVDGARFLREGVIVVDNGDPGTSSNGDWNEAIGATEHFGTVSVYATARKGVTDSYRFTPEITKAGEYEVSVWNSCFSPRDTEVPHTIVYEGGQSTVTVDQDCETGTHGEWYVLGTFSFAAETDGYVEISTQGLAAHAVVGADAVRFVPISSCQVVEDFEGPWPNPNWGFRGSGGVGTKDSLAHDGSFSLRDMGWYYNGNVTVGNPGDTLSWWVYATGGRAYLAFDSNGSGARSFILARNTRDIRFQNNANWGFQQLNRSSHTFREQWYYVEIEFLGGGEVLGRLFDEDGETLLNSVTQVFNDTNLVGGIAIRSFLGNRVDTVQVCN